MPASPHLWVPIATYASLSQPLSPGLLASLMHLLGCKGFSEPRSGDFIVLSPVPSMVPGKESIGSQLSWKEGKMYVPTNDRTNTSGDSHRDFPCWHTLLPVLPRIAKIQGCDCYTRVILKYSKPWNTVVQCSVRELSAPLPACYRLFPCRVCQAPLTTLG